MPTNMNSESLVKSGIAEHIFEVVMERSGYKVVRIAREGLLSGIPREFTENLNHSDSAGKITTAPSFAVFDRKGVQVILAKIKYRSENSRGRNISHGIKQLVRYWPEAALILITPEDPYFRVVLAEANEVRIEKLFSEVKKEALAEGAELVKKFL